jgi:transposase
MEEKMPTQDERVKKYIVRLSGEERERLEAIIEKGKAAARQIARARILLKADISEAGEGWSDSRIMEALNVSASLVYDARRQLVEEGFEAAITRKKRARPPVARIFDGAKEARLIQLACSKPPKGYARWSLRLLESKVVELNIVDAASDSTIGRVLKKTSCNPTATNNGSFRRRPMRRS